MMTLRCRPVRRPVVVSRKVPQPLARRRHSPTSTDLGAPERRNHDSCASRHIRFAHLGPGKLTSMPMQTRRVRLRQAFTRIAGTGGTCSVTSGAPSGRKAPVTTAFN
jgi:hypothetical protein